MLVAPGGSDVGDDAYTIVSQLSTYRVNPNNTTTPIEQITARSTKFGVTYMFNVLMATYLADGAAGLTSEKNAQVNYIAAHEHVVGVRGEQDQGPDGNLYNYLVVTVGTDDGLRTQDIRIRMDHLGDQSAFAAIEQAWARILALGPTAPDETA